MANKFTRYLGQFFGLDSISGIGQLGGVLGGLANPKGGMGDYQHASRLFLDDSYRLAPRTKFNYYVRFDIDKAALRTPNFLNKHVNEFGLLIKRADMPKFNFDTVTKNQYNRKKIIYKMINYDPVSFSFHDDNQGIVNALLAVYYGYYANDRHLPTSAYEANHYRSTNTRKDLFRYGLDKDSAIPFLKSITIYTMARRRFLSYTLINPKIKSWDHGNMDYSLGNEVNEHAMTVEYESVIYGSGTVGFNKPAGFANLHYDVSPSPLSVAGGGVASVTGEGGILDGIETIFGDIQRGDAFSSGGNFLSTVIKGINTYKNYERVKDKGFSNVLKGEVLDILSSPRGVQAISTTISGVAGAVFPKATTSNDVTNTIQKNLINRNIG